MKVSNKNARDCVNALAEFEGSNTFSKWYSFDEYARKLYVVYSYGRHFPMYVYDDEQDKWIGNKDKFSQSTSRHQSLLRPSDGVEMWLNTEGLRELINNHGLVGYTIHKAQT
jgi:hypothetical protein